VEFTSGAFRELDTLARSISSRSLSSHERNPRTTTFIRSADQLRWRSRPPPPCLGPLSQVTSCCWTNLEGCHRHHTWSATRGDIIRLASSSPHGQEKRAVHHCRRASRAVTAQGRHRRKPRARPTGPDWPRSNLGAAATPRAQHEVPTTDACKMHT
jgi:hypothetical protein